jgi:hypothetical protein
MSITTSSSVLNVTNTTHRLLTKGLSADVFELVDTPHIIKLIRQQDDVDQALELYSGESIVLEHLAQTCEAGILFPKLVAHGAIDRATGGYIAYIVMTRLKGDHHSLDALDPIRLSTSLKRLDTVLDGLDSTIIGSNAQRLSESILQSLVNKASSEKYKSLAENINLALSTVPTPL